MLGKILLTLAVIALAYFYLRRQQRGDSSSLPKQKPAKRSPGKGSTGREGKTQTEAARSIMANDFRIAAYWFLGLMTLIGGGLYYFQWREDHRVLTVTLHRDNQSEPVSYQVYQHQLLDRSFTTTDGIVVTVALDERMEVVGLEN